MVDLESGNLNVCLNSAENITAFLSGGNVQIIVGDSAKIEVGQAINYIKSGKAELQPLVLVASDSATSAANSATSAANSATNAQNVLSEMADALSDYTKIQDSIFYEEI